MSAGPLDHGFETNDYDAESLTLVAEGLGLAVQCPHRFAVTSILTLLALVAGVAYLA